ncbi:hypothetical protein Sjap_008638 [Stephania japonica]|uniref:Uncharacterized protein n=1 Tax=Stephania japonica TaxID=461633 RepID=A0AAP0JQD6_9MAGN
MVLFNLPTYDKLLPEAPKYKLIISSVLSYRLRLIFLLHSFVTSIVLGPFFARNLRFYMFVVMGITLMRCFLVVDLPAKLSC